MNQYRSYHSNISGIKAKSIQFRITLTTWVSEGYLRRDFTRLISLEATDDGAVIVREARRLLFEVGPTDPVRLIGVGVSGLDEEGSAEQLGLFSESQSRGREGAEDRAALNQALDEITSRFGSGTVVRASQGRAERAGLSHQIKRGEDPD